MTFLLVALAGLLFLGSVVLARARIRRAARKINAMVERSFADGHRLIPAEPAQFPWLCSDFYEQAQRDLESEGFRFLANVEDATLSETHPDKRTYVRLFTMPDGIVRAAVWEIVLGGPQGLPQTTVRTVELLTELTDGGCVYTTTAPAERLLDPGPWTFRQHCPPGTPARDLLVAQRSHLERHLSARPGVAVLPVRTYDEALEAWLLGYTRIRLKLAERGGVSREEMRRFARPGQQRLAEVVHAEMRRQKR